ncbi:hypothetical protein ACFU5P_27850 [Streptomyces sp. NPDC057433]|uniref:hypothetical protein n=1 Tax=Streptomyces sp. NPDC057433 TaxID=3346132 RepID=UPI0036C1C25F
MASSSRLPGALGSGDASAVIDVSVPHTTGSSAEGNARVTSRCSVGSRTARWNQRPHLVSLTV